MRTKPDNDFENWKLESRKKAYQELIQLIGNGLDFRRWGFQKTFSLIASDFLPSVIYDSEWCRVRFVFNQGYQQYRAEMSICYGRLHAPNTPTDDTVMILNGEKCFCWHYVNDVLNFLDGLSPREAIDQMRVYHKWPLVIEKLRQSEHWKGKTQAETQVIINAMIWEHYGQRFFELFDLRRPDLWEQYTHYKMEYQRIEGNTPISGYPASDKIC